MTSVAVLGASGTLGKAVVDELIQSNIEVKILVRNIESYKSLYPEGKFPGRVNVVQGDLDTNQSLATTLEYVDTIFICFNTKYPYWESDMLRWIDKIASLASALEARIVFPGCVYNFSNTSSLITEDDPQDSSSEIGQLKISVETRLYRASVEGAHLTIVRLPDIFGPGNFSSQIGHVFSDAVANKTAGWRGNLEMNHEFIYSKDAAKAIVRAGLSQDGIDKVFHFGGHTVNVKNFLDKIYEISESEVNPGFREISVWRDRFINLFWRKHRFMSNVRYYNENTLKLSSERFEKEIGKISLTPLNESIIETVNWYKFWHSNLS